MQRDNIFCSPASSKISWINVSCVQTNIHPTHPAKSSWCGSSHWWDLHWCSGWTGWRAVDWEVTVAGHYSLTEYNCLWLMTVTFNLHLFTAQTRNGSRFCVRIPRCKSKTLSLGESCKQLKKSSRRLERSSCSGIGFSESWPLVLSHSS